MEGQSVDAASALLANYGSQVKADIAAPQEEL